MCFLNLGDVSTGYPKGPANYMPVHHPPKGPQKKQVSIRETITATRVALKLARHSLTKKKFVTYCGETPRSTCAETPRCATRFRGETPRSAKVQRHLNALNSNGGETPQSTCAETPRCATRFCGETPRSAHLQRPLNALTVKVERHLDPHSAETPRCTTRICGKTPNPPTCRDTSMHRQ